MTSIDTASKTAKNLVDELRAALVDSDPVSAIVIIKQIEIACEIAYTLDSLCSAMKAQDSTIPVY